MQNQTPKGKFSGKKLLMLGSNIEAVHLVKYARQNGAYTIVADNLPPARSAAKPAAHEAVQISTACVDSLSELIREREIDGVLSGISEFNLLRAMELSERHHLPFYCTREQWDQVERKDGFRALCKRYQVPCPETYYIGSDPAELDLSRLVYPLLLKPVDCSASKGVYICKTEEELLRQFSDALSCSDAGRVIVEEFVPGDEFTVNYTICGGKASCSSIDNRYPIAVHEGNVTTIPIARIYPSTFIDSYMKQVNPTMLRLCEGLGIQDGILFVQGIYNAAIDGYRIFEAGLRSSAEAPNRFLSVTNGIDYMEQLVDHALLGYSTLDLSKDDPYMHGKCCGIVSFVARHGVVGSILGLEDAVRATPSVIAYESRYPVGSVTPDTDTLRQLMIRFVMVCDSREQMARDVAYLNAHVQVLDDQGENMVLKMDPERVLREFFYAPQKTGCENRE